MRISIIAAIDRRGLIGNETGLPWHLPGDLRRFRTYTWGKPIIMGRKTFESIGKPLPGRFNIILSHNPKYGAPGCQVARTFQEALTLAREYLARAGGDEVVIIGGDKVFTEVISCWDRLYLTVVEGQFQGNAYFPIRELLREKWRPTCEPELHPPDEKNPHRHSFHILERVGNAGCPGREEDWLHTGLEGLDLDAILRRGTLKEGPRTKSTSSDGPESNP